MEQLRLRIAVLLAIANMVFPFNCLATEYTVGDTQQWALGVNYTAWASGKTFTVGDKLVFTYASSQHDVVVVNKAAYDSCTATSPLNSFTTGNDTITLNTTGTHYYICGFTGHCSGGMKLAVTAAAASTTKSNGSVPSPSPAPATRPSAAPTPATTAKSPTPASSTAPTPTTSKSPSPSISTTPTPPTGQLPPVPSSANTPPVAPTPRSTTTANSPTGSNKSAAAPSYGHVGAGVLVLGGSLLFAMAL